MLDARAVNLWGFLLLLAAGLALAIPVRRRSGGVLLVAWIVGYAVWSVVFFLPPSSRVVLAWPGAIAALLAGASILAYAARADLRLTACPRAALWTGAATAIAATIFGEATVLATGPATTEQGRASLVLFGGIMPFVAGVAGALVILGMRIRRSAVALASPAGWTLLGLAALAGVVGARYWMTGPPTAPYYLGLAVGYTAGIAGATIATLTSSEARRGRTLAWAAATMLLAGMIVFLFAGSVASLSGAYANHVARFVAFGAVVYGATRDTG